MVVKKPETVIIEAVMAGFTAAKKLYSSTVNASKDMFELCVVEGGNRIGGRINTSQFGGDRIEIGATWIHGIVGSPIHNIAQQINSLESNSDQPWALMDENSNSNDPITIAEGGYVLNLSTVEPITKLFRNLMDHARKLTEKRTKRELQSCYKLAAKASKMSPTNGDTGNLSELVLVLFSDKASMLTGI